MLSLTVHSFLRYDPNLLLIIAPQDISGSNDTDIIYLGLGQGSEIRYRKISVLWKNMPAKKKQKDLKIKITTYANCFAM